MLPACLAFYLSSVRVQAHSTASGAGDMGANVTSATSEEEANEVKDKTKRRRGGGRRGRGGVAPL